MSKSEFVPVKNTRTAPKVETERQRASSGKEAKGGSVYTKIVNGRAQIKMSIVRAFQEAHKLLNMGAVMIAFSPKTKVLSVKFVKAAVPGETFSIDRDAKSQTAFLTLTSLLHDFGFQLKESRYNMEYTFSKGGDIMLVDLSDNLEKYVAPEIKRDDNGRLAPLTAKEKAARRKAVEESVA